MTTLRLTKGSLMEEKTKENLKKGAKVTAHGLGDIAEVAGHIVAGTVKGAADGVEAVANHHRDGDGEDDRNKS
jgi:hypothetical protein